MSSTARRQFEVLWCDHSRLGLLCLRRRELLSQPGVVVTEVTLDHELLMTSHVTDSERALASSALAMHGGSGLSVLVGGLGLGYTALEALRSDRAARVEVVEILPEVVGWLDAGLIPTAAELQRDPRLVVVQGDVYGRLLGGPPRLHDVILIDVDHSPAEALGDESAGFHTIPGLSRVKDHLAPGGVLGVWSYAESSPFAEALRSSFGEVRVEAVAAFNDLVDEEQTDWLFFARDPLS